MLPLEIDVTPFIQVIEDALRFAYFTVIGLGFAVALYAMGSILVAIWEGRDD